jgi:hypothetical protein
VPTSNSLRDYTGDRVTGGQPHRGLRGLGDPARLVIARVGGVASPHRRLRRSDGALEFCLHPLLTETLFVHAFIDESMRDGYMLCAVTVAAGDVAALRKRVDALRPRGSARIHMNSVGKKEAPKLITEVAKLDASRRLYVVRSANTTLLPEHPLPRLHRSYRRTSVSNVRSPWAGTTSPSM